LSSYDVSSVFIYFLFYLLLGVAWLYLGTMAVFALFDLSWTDDVLNMGNNAAMITLAGAFLGITLIYSGANIGDGPGWWCVFIAGGLGVIVWFSLGLLIKYCADVFDRITIDRDLGCGIRIGCYLLASGLILARASAGDWTSFVRTIIEFADGWPVLPLTAAAILIERLYMARTKNQLEPDSFAVPVSIILGAVYISSAVLALVFANPLHQNPLYPGW
jgi:hypothetical protein